MTKIEMKNPIVEMDGDEMTRVIWQLVKDKLILPFVDLKTEYYDLSLVNREATKDKVTTDAANATLKHHVAVKCATITPNAQRVEEYNLSEMWKSPNGTIRAILDGTVFRAPVLVKGITPLVPTWTSPIIIARHAYGDVYKNVEKRMEQGDKAYLVIEGKNPSKQLIFDFENTAGVVQGQHNLDKSIFSFARSCFNFALSEKKDLWFSTKDTISKIYDHRFKDIFQEVYDGEYKEKFEAAGIEYFYVMSDMVATAFGSLAMMTSVLVSPDGNYEYEAAHGTVTRHYYRYLGGEKTSTNPVATIFAWTGAFKKRGELDANGELIAFAEKLEKAVIDTIESGYMTKDLAALFDKQKETHSLNTEEFFDAIASRL